MGQRLISTAWVPSMALTLTMLGLQTTVEEAKEGEWVLSSAAQQKEEMGKSVTKGVRIFHLVAQ